MKGIQIVKNETFFHHPGLPMHTRRVLKRAIVLNYYPWLLIESEQTKYNSRAIVLN